MVPFLIKAKGWVFCFRQGVWHQDFRNCKEREGAPALGCTGATQNEQQGWRRSEQGYGGEKKPENLPKLSFVRELLGCSFYFFFPNNWECVKASLRGRRGMWKEIWCCSIIGFIGGFQNMFLKLLALHSLSVGRPWRQGLGSSAQHWCKETKWGGRGG